jgi:hypothetical protein
MHGVLDLGARQGYRESNSQKGTVPGAYSGETDQSVRIQTDHTVR